MNYDIGDLRLVICDWGSLRLCGSKAFTTESYFKSFTAESAEGTEEEKAIMNSEL